MQSKKGMGLELSEKAMGSIPSTTPLKKKSHLNKVFPGGGRGLGCNSVVEGMPRRGLEFNPSPEEKGGEMSCRNPTNVIVARRLGVHRRLELVSESSRVITQERKPK